ncbi:glutathione S-transferase, partial [Methylobacterium sp. WL122]
IALACALGYLDLRFADLGWREGRPNLAAWLADFSERASMRATA